jgi:hypothetical protein
MKKRIYRLRDRKIIDKGFKGLINHWKIYTKKMEKVEEHIRNKNIKIARKFLALLRL